MTNPYNSVDDDVGVPDVIDFVDDEPTTARIRLSLNQRRLFEDTYREMTEHAPTKA